MTTKPIDTDATPGEGGQEAGPPSITVPILQARQKELLAEEAKARAQLEVLYGARQDVEFWIAFLAGEIIVKVPSKDA